MKFTGKQNGKSRLPVQAAPVQRVLHTAVPVEAGQEGVDASQRPRNKIVPAVPLLARTLAGLM